LGEIDGALLHTPELEHRARGDIAVLQHPFGEAHSLRKAPGSDDVSAEEEGSLGADPLIVAELPPEVERDEATPLVSTEEAEEIRMRVSVQGTDALGWYVTFHQTAYQWGAYLSADGVRFLADPAHGIFGRLKISPRRRIELACHAILRHELMHFAVDYISSQWEIAAGLRCFWLARQKLRDPKLGYAPLEEELANGYMLRGFRFPSQTLREPGAFGLLKDFVETMPPGYRDGIKAIGKSAFETLLELLSCNFEGCLDRPYRTAFPEGFDFLSFYPSLRPIDWRYCTILLDAGRQAVPLSLQIITNISAIGESPRFKRSIQRMDNTDRLAWDRVKAKLRVSTQIPGLDFKPWKQDVFSVRVSDSVRAHLRLIRETGEWVAETIGHHKEMGHG
jgi:hypothetical protein